MFRPPPSGGGFLGATGINVRVKRKFGKDVAPFTPEAAPAYEAPGGNISETARLSWLARQNLNPN